MDALREEHAGVHHRPGAAWGRAHVPESDVVAVHVAAPVAVAVRELAQGGPVRDVTGDGTADLASSADMLA